MGLFEKFIGVFYPHRCPFCGRVISRSDDYCEKCAEEISFVGEPVCRMCGREKEFCVCKNRSRFFDGLTAPFYYEGVVRNGIHRMKFRGTLSGIDFFADKMTKAVSDSYRDTEFKAVMCVPSSKKSIAKRGYNQSSILASAIAEKTGIPYIENGLVKLYETGTQHNLSFLRRKGNLTGAFDISDGVNVNGGTILLVDDVATSGETLDECSKMLYLYGADKIYCVTLAVTKEKKRN